MDIQQTIFFCIEIIGTLAFAASGAMTAIKREMDVFGVAVLAVVTSVGGGMTRDVILGKLPAALQRPIYVAVAVGVSLLIFTIIYFKRNITHGKVAAVYDMAMLIMDSVGLGVFTASGVIVGINSGHGDNVFLLAFLGTVTGVGGGLLRDILAGMPPYIFIKHIYALASVAGAVACVFLYRSFGQLPAVIVSSVLVTTIRFLAAGFRWNLPRIRNLDDKKTTE